MSQHLIAAYWMDRDDKTYFYGPYRGQDELALGMLFLSALWSDQIAAGRVGLYVHPLSPPAWLEKPTQGILAGLPDAPWLSGSGSNKQVQGFPLYCRDRPVKGDPTCWLLAGHAEPHQTREQFDADDDPTEET